MMMITVNNVPKDITTITMEMATDWSHQPPYRICRNQRQKPTLKGQCMMMVIFNHITDFTLNEVAYTK